MWPWLGCRVQGFTELGLWGQKGINCKHARGMIHGSPNRQSVSEKATHSEGLGL